jgi:hypothetical protein
MVKKVMAGEGGKVERRRGMGKPQNTERIDLTQNSPWFEREEDTEEAILAEARTRVTYGIGYWQEQWDAWRSDLEAIDGSGQWSADEQAKRIAEDRPCLIINTFDQFIAQVLGDGLQNRPSIQVIPGDSESESGMVKATDGLSNFSMAEVYEGLLRNAEYENGAEHHYDTALQHAIETGMGWLRVGTAYGKGITFDQDLKFSAVRNRWSVVIDPDCYEPDFSDANWAFVFHERSRAEFIKRWPDAGVDGFADMGDEGKWWANEDTVKVCEYFERVPVIRRLLQLTDGTVVYEDEALKIVDELAAKGLSVRRWRDIETNIVYRRLITGVSILEKKSRWVGSTIPLIPVAGKRLDFADKRIYRGLIHNAKDAKMAENFFLSAAVERIGLAPLAPWLVTAEQIEGYEKFWDNANKTNTPYLPFNEGVSTFVPTRTMPPPMPVAEVQMAAVFTDKVKAAIGMYDASVGARSNETSGRAILARQRESDVSSFVFMDNLSKAIRRLGIIGCEVIPKIYDSERIVRLRNKDGSTAFVPINKTIIDEETGKPVIINDMQHAKFDVVVKTGPSYTTQRMEAVEALLEFVRVVPSAGAVILDKIALNMDWPGADDIAKRLVKLIPPQFLTEKERADAGIDKLEPTPEQQVQMQTNEAMMARAAADTEMAKAKGLEAQAKMAELAAATSGPDAAMINTIRDLIAEGLAEVMAAANANPPKPTPDAPAKSAAA